MGKTGDASALDPLTEKRSRQYSERQKSRYATVKKRKGHPAVGSLFF
jgi:hypothetical protein